MTSVAAHFSASVFYSHLVLIEIFIMLNQVTCINPFKPIVLFYPYKLNEFKLVEW